MEIDCILYEEVVVEWGKVGFFMDGDIEFFLEVWYYDEDFSLVCMIMY